MKISRESKGGSPDVTKGDDKDKGVEGKDREHRREGSNRSSREVGRDAYLVDGGHKASSTDIKDQLKSVVKELYQGFTVGVGVQAE